MDSHEFIVGMSDAKGVNRDQAFAFLIDHLKDFGLHGGRLMENRVFVATVLNCHATAAGLFSALAAARINDPTLPVEHPLLDEISRYLYRLAGEPT